MDIKKNKIIKIGIEIIKFGIIGVLNAIIDFSIYISLTRGFEFWARYYYIANIIAFFIANIFSFFANKKITFKDDRAGSIKQYFKFLSITIMSLLITEICLIISVKYLQTSDVFGKIVGIAIGAIWNFVMYKIKIFKKY